MTLERLNRAGHDGGKGGGRSEPPNEVTTDEDEKRHGKKTLWEAGVEYGGDHDQKNKCQVNALRQVHFKPHFSHRKVTSCLLQFKSFCGRKCRFLGWESPVFSPSPSDLFFLPACLLLRKKRWQRKVAREKKKTLTQLIKVLH